MGHSLVEHRGLDGVPTPASRCGPRRRRSRGHGEHLVDGPRSQHPKGRRTRGDDERPARQAGDRWYAPDIRSIINVERIFYRMPVGPRFVGSSLRRGEPLKAEVNRREVIEVQVRREWGDETQGVVDDVVELCI